MTAPLSAPAAPTGGAPGSPTAIGRYRVIEKLGQGGMGVVFRAHDPQLARDVAIKMILTAGSLAADTRVRFEQEARTVARLRHPAIVSVHEIGEHQGQPFLVMDFVAGRTLERLVRDDAPGADALVDLVGNVARGIAHAHDHGVIHRDLKPANIMIADGTNEARVLDFGLARDLRSAGITASAALLGTPSYMAPEQADKSLGAVGPATDVYALGAILYRVLVGSPPFSADEPAAVIKQLLLDDPTPPRERDASIPRPLEAIVMRCLEKEPSHRYPSATALADDLERFRTGETPEALRESPARAPTARKARPSERTPARRASGRASARRARSGRLAGDPPGGSSAPGLPIIAAVVIGAVVVVGAFLVTRRREPDAGPDPARSAASDPARTVEPDESATTPDAADPDDPPGVPTPSKATVTFEGPEEGAVFTAETLTVSGRVTGAEAATLDREPLPLDPEGRFERAVSIAGAADGPRTFVLLARGADGEELRVERTVTLDVAPPVAVVTAPRPGATPPLTAEASITIRGRVEDARPAAVRVGALEAPVAADGSFALTVPIATDGEHRLELVARDAAGRESEPVSIVVLRDATPPTLSLEAPEEELVTREGEVEVRGHVAEASDRPVSVTVNGREVPIEPDGRFAATVPTAPLEVRATDAAGNVATAKRAVRIDRAGPVLTLEPTLPARVDTSVSRIELGGTADEELATVEVNGRKAKVDGAAFTFTLRRLKRGENEVELVATDALGNESRIEGVVTRGGDARPAATTVKLPATIGTHPGGVRSLAVSSDGRWLAAGSRLRGKTGESTVRIWSLATADVPEAASFPVGSQVYRVAWCPTNPDLVAASGEGKPVRVWSAREGRVVRTFRLPVGDLDVHGLGWTPDGRRLVVCGRINDKEETSHGWAFRCDVPDAEPIALRGLGRSAEHLSAHPTSSTVVVGDANGVQSFSAETGKLVRKLSGPRWANPRPSWSPDGRRLLVMNTAGRDHRVFLWTVGDPGVTELSENQAPRGAAWSPDGRLAAVGYNSGRVLVYRTDESKTVVLDEAVDSNACYAMAFTPDGRYLIAAGGDDGVIRAFPLADR